MNGSLYSDELRNQASRLLSDSPNVAHEWRASGELAFPARSAQGFEVILKPETDGIVVFTNVGFHHHADGPPTQAVEDALGLTRDLLSPDMRIREKCAGGQGYRWILERHNSDGWTFESRVGLLFWNYFGRRSEAVYRNHQLPGRLNAS